MMVSPVSRRRAFLWLSTLALGLAFLVVAAWFATRTPGVERLRGEVIAEMPEAHPEPGGGLAANLRGRAASPADSRVRSEASMVEGLVIDRASGAPVSGAAIRWRAASTRSAPNGWFVLPVSVADLDGGLLDVSADGYLRRTEPLSEGDVTPLGRLEPIRLDRVARRIEGLVRDSRGFPVGGVLVVVESTDARFTSASDGVFGPIAMAETGSIRWRAWRFDRVLVEGVWTSDRVVGSDVLDIVLPDVDLVDGLVVNERGEPTPGASVSEDGQPTEFHVTSDQMGTFVWPMAAGGSAVLVARSPNGQGSRLASAGVPVRIVAWEGGSVTRIVASPPPPPATREPLTLTTHSLQATDERGVALAGARLTVRSTSLDWATSEVTDVRGFCELAVPAGEVLLDGSYFRPHTFERIRVPSPDSSFPTTVVFNLLEVASVPRSMPPEALPGVVGRIEDWAGRPVMNAEVTTNEGSARTDARGEFVIEGGSAGDERYIEVRVAGFPPSRLQGIVGGQKVVHRLPRRGEVSIQFVGRPSGDDGSEIRGSVPAFAVWEGLARDPILESPDDESLLVDQGDRAGLYLPPGTYRIGFQCDPGGWTQYLDVNVSSTSATALTYDFRSLGGIRLSVRTVEGSSVADASICIAETGIEIGRTDASGTLLVRGGTVHRNTPVGTWRLLTMAQSLAPAVSGPFDLSRPTTATLTLEKGVSVTGTVTDKAGVAIAGTISWLPGVGPDQIETEIEEDGAFAFAQPLPPGRQRFRIRRTGHSPFDVYVQIDALQTTAVLGLVAP